MEAVAVRIRDASRVQRPACREAEKDWVQRVQAKDPMWLPKSLIGLGNAYDQEAKRQPLTVPSIPFDSQKEESSQLLSVSEVEKALYRM